MMGLLRLWSEVKVMYLNESFGNTVVLTLRVTVLKFVLPTNAHVLFHVWTWQGQGIVNMYCYCCHLCLANTSPLPTVWWHDVWLTSLIGYSQKYPHLVWDAIAVSSITTEASSLLLYAKMKGGGTIVLPDHSKVQGGGVTTLHTHEWSTPDLAHTARFSMVGYDTY